MTVVADPDEENRSWKQTVAAIVGVLATTVLLLVLALVVYPPLVIADDQVLLLDDEGAVLLDPDGDPRADTAKVEDLRAEARRSGLQALLAIALIGTGYLTWRRVTRGRERRRARLPPPLDPGAHRPEELRHRVPGRPPDRKPPAVLLDPLPPDRMAPPSASRLSARRA